MNMFCGSLWGSTNATAETTESTPFGSVEATTVQGALEAIAADCENVSYRSMIAFIVHSLFANGEKGGYWPVAPGYLFEDSAGTTPASIGGLVGCCVNAVAGQPNATAYQNSDSYKPRLHRTPRSRKLWLDTETTGYELTAVFSSELGSTCTVVTVNLGGVKIEEDVTIPDYYSIMTSYYHSYNGGILVIDRPLTEPEKELLDKHLMLNFPAYGSVQNAVPQIRGLIPDTEQVFSGWSGLTSLASFWRYAGPDMFEFEFIDTSNIIDFSSAWFNCEAIEDFPLLDTSNGTNFSRAWFSCASLEDFPLLDISNGTNFYNAWYGCEGLYEFPLVDTGNGLDFGYAWGRCRSLEDFPLLDISNGTNFFAAWSYCAALVDFPEGMFDSWVGVPQPNCFGSSWSDCDMLSEDSVSNIVVSIAASGKSAPATETAIDLSGAPSIETIQANSTIMAAVTTLKSRGWIPTYNLTAL